MRLTEQENALDFLRRGVEFLRRVDAEDVCWKWVVISLHCALYGFAVCACQGTDPDTVKWTRKKKGKEEEFLIGFDEALRRCQKKETLSHWMGSKPLVLSKSQERSLRYLKEELRDNFVHFSPMAWSIELHGLPTIALDVLDIMDFLVVRSGTYALREPGQTRMFKELVAEARKILLKNELYLEYTRAKEAEDTQGREDGQSRGKIAD